MMGRIAAGSVEGRWSWLRTTGLACLVLVLVECITGPILGLYYTPSPTAAYKAIQAIETDPMGRFLRGIHHWASAALILLAIFTIARMFFRAEYKKRDIVWIVTLVFFGLVMMFQLTGHILPWDTNSAATAGVEAGFGGNVWIAGPYVKRFLLGGGSVGGATLTRWYGFHVLVFPILLLLLTGIPLASHRLRTNRTDEESGHEPYYPNHLAREMIVALAVFLVVAGLAWFKKTPLELEATAENLTSYQALSEWYVLPLHAITTLPPFDSVAWEPIATIVMPSLLLLILLVLPFRDRAAKGNGARIALGFLALAGTGGLYLMAYVKEAPLAKEQAAKLAAAPGESVPKINAELAASGKRLYGGQHCDACHSIAGKGGKAAPDLTRAARLHPDRDWQIAHLIKPDSKSPGSTMPAYGTLKKDELAALAEYLVSLR